MGRTRAAEAAEEGAGRLREAVLGFGPGGSRIVRAFDLMGVAEREIERAKAAEEGEAGKQAAHAAFRLLPPGELAGFGDGLYEAHCREILGRVSRGEDCRPGTDAEGVAALSTASLRAPLGQAAAAAMEVLFARCFPENRVGGGRVGLAPWEGAELEVVAELRRKCAKEWRR